MIENAAFPYRMALSKANVKRIAKSKEYKMDLSQRTAFCPYSRASNFLPI